ncbi:glycerate kinase [Oscillospiraceae bacterium 50-58]
MKKCVVVSDSFKGTLSSLEICNIARQSVPRFFPSCQVVTVPVADGGEGTVECFIQVGGYAPEELTVSGPWGEPVRALWARREGRAVIEMACAAGLPMVGERKNPELTTTYGVGQVIRHAVELGCTEILLGLGGSCTNDGGCGCAAALGVKFFNRDGAEFVPVGGTLDQIARIDPSGAKELLQGVTVTAMCDVDNPLFGPLGAAHIFGPQKGAGQEMVARLDGQLRCLDAALRRELSLSLAGLPGAGAAGGMGAGCVAFLWAELRPGIEAVLDMVDFDGCLEGADLVITGEGRIDAQSVRGKVISGVARRTAPRNIPLVAIVGGIGEDAEEAYALGVTAMFGIDRPAHDFARYAHRSADYYRRTLEDVLRLIRAVTE